MASPSEAEVNAMWQAAIALLDNHLASQTVVADEDAYVQTLESDFAPAMTNGARLFRSRVAAAVGSGSAVQDGVLLTYAQHVSQTPERSAQRALDRIYQYFIDNARTVQSRDIGYGAIPSFGAGKGALFRLTEDENAFPLENEFVETKTIRCIRDENTGARRHEEVFEFRGDAAGVDTLDANASGAVDQSKRAQSSNDSLLANSSFSRASIAGVFAAGRYDLIAGDSVTSWQLLDPAQAVDETIYALEQAGIASGSAFARDVVGDATPTSLVFKADGILRQAFSENSLSLSAATPYPSEIWVKAKAGVTAGVLTVRWGTQSVAIADLSTLTTDVWNRLISPMDQNIWPAIFNTQDAVWEVEVSGLTGGEVAVDEVFFGPMQPFDGTWWHISGGAFDATPAIAKFALDDSIQVADAFNGTDSKIQKWLWRSYGRYLPSTTGVPTLTDPP